MTFLAMIIALVLERLSPLEDVLHRDAWFARWQQRVEGMGLPAGLSLGLTVLLPCLLAHLVLDALSPLLFGLAWIAGAVVLLLYALGRGRLGAVQEHYRSQCRREDFEGALLAVNDAFDWFDESGESLDADAIHRRVQQGFLYEGYQRWFAVLFYFLLLGPVGALAYRLLQLAVEGREGGRQLLYYVDWVPVRLLAAAFALTGNFVASADELWGALSGAAMDSPQVLYTVALAATGEDAAAPVEGGISGQRAAAQNEVFAALLRRASICWLAVISALVILL